MHDQNSEHAAMVPLPMHQPLDPPRVALRGCTRNASWTSRTAIASAAVLMS